MRAVRTLKRFWYVIAWGSRKAFVREEADREIFVRTLGEAYEWSGLWGSSLRADHATQWIIELLNIGTRPGPCRLAAKSRKRLATARSLPRGGRSDIEKSNLKWLTPFCFLLFLPSWAKLSLHRRYSPLRNSNLALRKTLQPRRA